MIGSSPESRAAGLKFNIILQLILLVMLLLVGVRGIALIICVVLFALSDLMLLAAHNQMMRIEKSMQDDIWWLMCLGGREAANKFKMDSLKDLDEAEEAFAQQRSFDNLRKLENKKGFHEIVLKAYKRAIDDIDRVETTMNEVLGKESKNVQQDAAKKAN